jgi:hypothetical protein
MCFGDKHRVSTCLPKHALLLLTLFIFQNNQSPLIPNPNETHLLQVKLVFWELLACGFCTLSIVLTLVASDHGLAGSADSGVSCVIASQGKMADAMGFCVE